MVKSQGSIDRGKREENGELNLDCNGHSLRSEGLNAGSLTLNQQRRVSS